MRWSAIDFGSAGDLCGRKLGRGCDGATAYDWVFGGRGGAVVGFGAAQRCGKIGAAGLTYLSDRERRLVLSQQMEVMGRLAPQDCVLYANAQVTLDSIAKNATATGAFLQTMSNQEVQAILDAQLNTMSLGALHQAKPRRMTRAQYEEMQKLTGEAIVDWMLSFAPEDQERFAQFLWGDASKLSADDACAINISLNQMALEAEGNTGELVRLAMMLGFFDEDELISD